MRLGGELQAIRVLQGVTLKYPALARAAHVVGKVIVAALIDETGKVIRVRAVSGPPILAAAAVDAVSRERFIPLVLDGEPTATSPKSGSVLSNVRRRKVVSRWCRTMLAQSA